MHTRASEINKINWLRLVQSSIDVLHFVRRRRDPDPYRALSLTRASFSFHASDPFRAYNIYTSNDFRFTMQEREYGCFRKHRAVR